MLFVFDSAFSRQEAVADSCFLMVVQCTPYGESSHVKYSFFNIKFLKSVDCRSVFDIAKSCR